MSPDRSGRSVTSSVAGPARAVVLTVETFGFTAFVRRPERPEARLAPGLGEQRDERKQPTKVRLLAALPVGVTNCSRGLPASRGGTQTRSHE